MSGGIRARDVVNKKQKPFCLVNGSGVSIHQAARSRAIRRSAFIFDEPRKGMVNCGFCRRRSHPEQQFRL
jgi:hypothetical protein